MEPDGTKKQLYNLEKDPKESKNLVNAEKGVSGPLISKLNNWYKDVVKKNRHGN